MSPIHSAVDSVLKSPIKHYSKDEAVEMFKRYGVLDNDGKVTEAYRDIVVEANESREKRNV